MEELIIRRAKELFFAYGVKGVSMDDIARAAGMSKKTIYKSFEDKIHLVRILVEDMLQGQEAALAQFAAEAQDAIHEVVLFSRAYFTTTGDICQGFFYDLEKQFPAVWQLIEHYVRTVLITNVATNVRRGIEEGIYRTDMDIAFIAELRVQQIVTAFNPRTFPNTKPANKLMSQLSEFYLHGITTTKGKKIINKYLNVNNETHFQN